MRAQARNHHVAPQKFMTDCVFPPPQPIRAFDKSPEGAAWQVQALG
jgi:hypothetical protein